MYGGPSEIIVNKDYKTVIITGSFIPIFIILIVLLAVICVVKGICKSRKRSMDKEDKTVRVEELGMKSVYGNPAHEDAVFVR